MDIFTQIMKAADRFRAETCKTPKTLYLGYEEMSSVRLAKAALAFVSVPGPNKRTEVCGMAVFVVDANSHLGVGVDL